MQLVQATGLTKTFSGVRAVDDVSLTVARGEVVGFLGPNGAGKSTTMKMLTGFLTPDAGTASIAGEDVFRRPLQARARLGYLPEGAPAYGDMSVGDFLVFIGRMRGLTGARLDERLAEMVERVNLEGVWNRSIDALSKGFKRRVGIAQALIHDPDVLILDEPTDGLDPNQKHDMRELIRSIAAGKAIVVSTHILEEVEATCSRVVIIAEGRVVADDTPAALLAKASGPSTLRVSVASGAAAVVGPRLKTLRPDAAIEELEPLDGAVRFLLRFGEDAADPGALARDLAAAGIAVEEIGLYRPSLESVFRAVTGTRPH
jgi:ABC-2 type transport system ATP-binding protein